MVTVSNRLNGLTSSEAIKAPCVGKTVGNVTLSGLQTHDGLTMKAGERWLVGDQTDKKENGIYIVSDTEWERAKDFDGNRDVVNGTMVYVANGTSNKAWWSFSSNSDPIVIGTSEIVIVPANLVSLEPLKGTSATSVTIGTGSKTFVTQENRLFDAGSWLLISSAADGSNYMHGQVTSYSGTSLTVNVTTVGGSGTYSDWNIIISGVKGADGADGSISDLTGVPAANIALSDKLIFADASNSDTTASDTVQNLLNLNTVSAGLNLISTVDVTTAVASVDFTSGIDSTYDEYIIKFSEVDSDAYGGYLHFKCSSDGGVTYYSGGNNYAQAGVESQSDAAAPLKFNVDSNVYGDIAGPKSALYLGGISGELVVFKPYSPNRTLFASRAVLGGSNMKHFSAGFVLKFEVAVNAIRFAHQGGNIISGTFRLYGVTK